MFTDDSQVRDEDVGTVLGDHHLHVPGRGHGAHRLEQLERLLRQRHDPAV